MAKAPVPVQLPGDIFVLEWHRDREIYVITVDDGNWSTFNLGSDVQKVMWHFRRWGLKDTGYAAIDIARSFGAAKAHIPTGRTAAVFDRDAELKAAPVFKEDSDDKSRPVLRSHL